ncbi:MAG: hypothetical protein KBD64_07095 [Gammaproteobacteria bacterium]|nr:hypothetical protein [Gammaproteobacteria bacterium]
MTFSQALDQVNPDIALPPTESLSKFIKKHIFSKSVSYKKRLNIFIIWISLLLFVGAVAPFIRAIFYKVDPKLDAEEPDSEAFRGVAVGIYFLGYFLIAFVSAIVSYKLLFLKKLEKKYQKAIEFYQTFRIGKKQQHDLYVVFFSFLEILVELKLLKQSIDHLPGDYTGRYLLIKTRLDAGFIRINYPIYSLPSIFAVTSSINSGFIQSIIDNIKIILLSQTFQRITYALYADLHSKINQDRAFKTAEKINFFKKLQTENVCNFILDNLSSMSVEHGELGVGASVFFKESDMISEMPKTDLVPALELYRSKSIFRLFYWLEINSNSLVECMYGSVVEAVHTPSPLLFHYGVSFGSYAMPLPTGIRREAMLTSTIF